MSLCINPNCNHQNLDNLLFCESCNSELLIVGKYRVTQPIGQGGFGQTYEVDSRNGKKVLKVLFKNSPKAIELFQREAKVLSEINHSGIPQCDGYFEFTPQGFDGVLHCLIMDKIEGNNLREYIKQRGRPIDGNLAQDWLIELLEILDKVHSQGILHRDIKPDNIILDPYGKLFLIDFGAVKDGETLDDKTELVTDTEGVTRTQSGTAIYTIGYTANEQKHGQAIPESDIYALGCTFVYLLTGKEPKSKDNYDSYYDRIDWEKNASNIPPQLATVINQAIEPKASDRPNSCKEILASLNQNKSVKNQSDSEGDRHKNFDKVTNSKSEPKKNSKESKGINPVWMIFRLSVIMLLVYLLLVWIIFGTIFGVFGLSYILFYFVGLLFWNSLKFFSFDFLVSKIMNKVAKLIYIFIYMSFLVSLSSVIAENDTMIEMIGFSGKIIMWILMIMPISFKPKEFSRLNIF